MSATSSSISRTARFICATSGRGHGVDSGSAGTETEIAPIGRPARLWMLIAERGDALLGLFDVDRETGPAHTVEFAAELVELGRTEPAIGRVEFVVAGAGRFEVEPLPARRRAVRRADSGRPT